MLVLLFWLKRYVVLLVLLVRITIGKQYRNIEVGSVGCGCEIDVTLSQTDPPTQ